jgi:transcriptional regulator with XRE-family HTH domain
MTAEFVRERITQLRILKGVSEYKMSYDLGHSRGYVNNISSGKALPSMTEFFSICEYFGITPIEFFKGTVSDPGASRRLSDDIEKLSPEDMELVSMTVKRLLKK